MYFSIFPWQPSCLYSIYASSLEVQYGALVPKMYFEASIANLLISALTIWATYALEWNLGSAFRLRGYSDNPQYLSFKCNVQVWINDCFSFSPKIKDTVLYQDLQTSAPTWTSRISLKIYAKHKYIKSNYFLMPFWEKRYYFIEPDGCISYHCVPLVINKIFCLHCSYLI